MMVAIYNDAILDKGKRLDYLVIADNFFSMDGQLSLSLEEIKNYRKDGKIRGLSYGEFIEKYNIEIRTYNSIFSYKQGE